MIPLRGMAEHRFTSVYIFTNVYLWVKLLFFPLISFSLFIRATPHKVHVHLMRYINYLISMCTFKFYEEFNSTICNQNNHDHIHENTLRTAMTNYTHLWRGLAAGCNSKKNLNSQALS